MVNEIHIAFLSCSIDTFSIQAFIVDKREGKWEIPRKGVVIKLGDSISLIRDRTKTRAEGTVEKNLAQQRKLLIF